MELKELSQNYLQSLYNRMSYREMLVKLKDKGVNCHLTTIARRCKKLGIVSRNQSSAQIMYNKERIKSQPSYLNYNIKQAIDGFALGDGHISQQSTVSARMTCCVKHKDFCGFMMNKFYPYNPQIAKYQIFDKRINKMAIGWRGWTANHKDFLIHKKRWYQGSHKILPKDVLITPVSVLMWYLGDGVFTLHNDKYRHLSLCTDSFPKDDVKKLIYLLSEVIDIDCWINNRNRIIIPTRSHNNFFKFIGPCPVKCYNYKWPQLDG